MQNRKFSKETISSWGQQEGIPLFYQSLGVCLICYERACLFGQPAVVKETHIPQSTVHVNCIIPPTLLLSLLATDTSKWERCHMFWVFSFDVHLSSSLSVALSVLALFSRVGASQSLVWIISPILALILSVIPRGHETAVWQNEATTELFSEVIHCEI